MYSGKPTFAVIGDVTLKESTSIYRKRVAITEWISHPNYAPPKIYDDIAVRQLQLLSCNSCQIHACKFCLDSKTW